MSDDEADAAEAAYDARLAAIASRLPPSLRQLRQLSLHDGIFERIVWQPAKQRLRFDIVVGGPTTTDGWRSVTLVYHGAVVGRQLPRLRQAGLSRETEIWYTELDLDEGFAEARLIHRLLLLPSEELTIWFARLELRVAPRTDPRVQLGRGFVELAADERWPALPKASKSKAKEKKRK